MQWNGNMIACHGIRKQSTKVRKAISLDWEFGSKVRKAISPDWKFGSEVQKVIFLDWKFGKFEKKVLLLKMIEVTRNMQK